jgi:hypothetical protein
MELRLKKNICNLDSDSAQPSEVYRNCINHLLPPELQYSCRYWVQHLVQSGEPAKGMVIAIPFLKIHFLHWVEAMSLLGIVSEALAMMGLLQSVAHVSLRPYCPANNRVKSLAWSNKDSETAKFILDLRRFILRNRYVANISPLQLTDPCYIAA